MKLQESMFAVAVVTVLVIGSGSAAADQAAAAPDAATIAKGATLFTAQKCMMCHSLDGKGNVKGPLNGVGTKLTAEEIRLWIVDPADMTKKTSATRKPAMRQYPNLAKGDVNALVAFLMTKRTTTSR